MKECYTCVAFPVWRRGSLVSHSPMEGATKEVRIGVMRGDRLFVEAA